MSFVSISTYILLLVVGRYEKILRLEGLFRNTIKYCL